MRYEPASLPEPELTISGQFTFVGIFVQFQSECETMYRKNGWAESTREQYSSIVRNIIYPHLHNHNFKSIGEYTKRDFDDAIEDICAAGKKKGASEDNKYDEATIQTFRRLIRTVVTVAYENQKSLYNIYDANFTEEKKKQLQEYYRLHNIQPKSFTVEQEYAITQYLENTCLDFGESVGLLLMFALGLRCAEATGASFDELIEIEGYSDFYCLIVLHTTGTNSNIIHIGGKTINANRIIPVPKSIYVLLKRIQAIRTEALLSAGIDVTNIKMPIACKGRDYLNRCDTPSISRAGREMFIHIGMRREFLIAISMEIDEDLAAAKEMSAEEEFALVEREPTAYALRRNTATHWHTLLANEDENAIAYLMGHKIYDTQIRQKEYSSFDLLYKISLKLNQRPILNAIHYDDVKYVPTSRVDRETVLTLTDVYDHIITIPPNVSVQVIATPYIPDDGVDICNISADAEVFICSQKRNVNQSRARSERNANMIRSYHRQYYEVIQDYVISLPDPQG